MSQPACQMQYCAAVCKSHPTYIPCHSLSEVAERLQRTCRVLLLCTVCWSRSATPMHRIFNQMRAFVHCLKHASLPFHPAEVLGFVYIRVRRAKKGMSQEATKVKSHRIEDVSDLSFETSHSIQSSLTNSMKMLCTYMCNKRPELDEMYVLGKTIASRSGRPGSRKNGWAAAPSMATGACAGGNGAILYSQAVMAERS